MNNTKPIQSANSKIWKAFYAFTGLTGLILAVFEVLLFRQTVINYIIPLVIIVVIGSVAFLFNKTHYNKVYALSRNFYAYLQNVFSWGFIAAYAFLAVNYYCADSNLTTLKFKILSKDSMPGPSGHRTERQQYIRINYNDVEKELVFNYAQTNEVNKADSVIVYNKKGALGFDIFSHYQLIGNNVTN